MSYIKYIPVLNDPKLTLNTTKSKVPYICVTTVPESQISVRFALRPAIFELHVILTLNTTRSKVPPICVTNVQSPKYQPILLYDQPVLRHMVVDNQNCTE